MSNPTESTFDYTITSSDPDMYYMPLSLATKLLPQFDADKEVSLVLQQINQLIGQYGFEMVAKDVYKRQIVMSNVNGFFVRTEEVDVTVHVPKYFL